MYSMFIKGGKKGSKKAQGATKPVQVLSPPRSARKDNSRFRVAYMERLVGKILADPNYLRGKYPRKQLAI